MPKFYIVCKMITNIIVQALYSLLMLTDKKPTGSTPSQTPKTLIPSSQGLQRLIKFRIPGTFLEIII
ncbi:MAG: hypothetical protein EOM16_10150 [Bacteroidia bacterium]|nr:hypothetical protein [Bacteroidia bacterium]